MDLIRDPMFKVESYKTCKCNGYKFACANPNELTSSNSGVVVIGKKFYILIIFIDFAIVIQISFY